MKKYDEQYDNAIGAELSNENEKDKDLVHYRIKAVILLIIGTILGLQVATQFFASSMSYNPELGAPVYGDHIYFFTDIFTKWAHYAESDGEDYRRAILMGMNVLMLVMAVIMIMKFNLQNKLKAQKYLHGSARWANRADIERMGLLPHKFSFKEKLGSLIACIPSFSEIPYLGTWIYKLANVRFIGFTGRILLKIPFLGKRVGKHIKNQKAEGVFVGAWQDRKTKKTYYLRHNGPEHILCVAPTRSGKGVGLVNPTLLTWTESAFVMDLKGELWALTSGWRKKYAHNKCIRFEPAEPRACINEEKQQYNVARWNPLDEIRAEGSIEYYFNPKTKKIDQRVCTGVQEIADVQNIATLIVDPDGKGLEDHWAKTAFALIVGAIIHLKHNCPDRCNIHTLDLMLAGQIDTATMRKKGASLEPEDFEQNGAEEDAGGIKNLWADMKLGLDCNGEKYGAREAVITAGADMFDRPDEEAGSVLSTAKSFISLYRDPIVAQNTSVSDFRIKQLMNMNDPVSLYVVTQPNDKGRLKPLVRLLVNLVVRLLADKMEFENGRSVKGYAHKILLMLDEFPSLGKLDIMQESLAFVAGYGIKAYLIVQDMAQLYTLYGKDESISSNCHVSNFYAPLRTDTAEIMSKKCGNTTITHENISLSGSGLKTSKSRSMQETSRPLLTVDECMQLPSPKKDQNGNIIESGKMLVFVAGFPAIYGVQPLYFQDPVLLDRAKVASPLATDIILKDGHIFELNGKIKLDPPKDQNKQKSDQKNQKKTDKLKKKQDYAISKISKIIEKTIKKIIKNPAKFDSYYNSLIKIITKYETKYSDVATFADIKNRESFEKQFY